MNYSEWNMISNESAWNGNWKDCIGDMSVSNCIASGIMSDAMKIMVKGITITAITTGTESGGWAFQFP